MHQGQAAGEPGRNPDIRYLLGCCLQRRWQQEAVRCPLAAEATADRAWERLIALARREGVAPLLYHGTRPPAPGLLPDWVLEELHLDYVRTARKNTLWFTGLEEALRLLAQQGVPVILLKGAALAEGLYGNLALRPMADIDLLVHERHVPLALESLSDLGYRYSGDSNLQPQDVHANQLMLRGPEPIAALIEVHWALFWFPYYQRSVSDEWLWSTARAVRVGDVSALALGPEALLLHLCGHLLHHYGGDGGPFRLLWIHDVVEFIQRHGCEVDWEMLIEQARDSDLVLALRQVFDQLADEWGAPIPAEVLGRLRAQVPAATEVRARSWLAATNVSMRRYPMASLAALPDWRSKTAYLWNDLLFPSRAFMVRRYAIRHPLLVPLYYPHRWISGLARELALRRATSPPGAPPE
ncbi:MAG: nucleotidyltransferase family protein [Anaerolineae bacterium]